MSEHEDEEQEREYEQARRRMNEHSRRIKSVIAVEIIDEEKKVRIEYREDGFAINRFRQLRQLRKDHQERYLALIKRDPHRISFNITPRNIEAFLNL